MAAEPALDSPVLVAPTTGSEHNTVRERLLPVAGWQVEDFHFAFGSSLLAADALPAFHLLAGLRRNYPGATLALFGHADPVGADELNKSLSGRRATAVYAALTRRIDLWQSLYDHPADGDDWKGGALETICEALQRDPPPRAQVHTLFAEYMDFLCQDDSGATYRLDPAADFLARGADAHGKGDYQGCGEFNPLLIFSQPEAKLFDAVDRHVDRNAANAPNRRVTGYLFPAGLRIDPTQWPCPRVSEGTGGCRKRFWSDAASRRQNGHDRRTRPASDNTYACRFYDRIAADLSGDDWMQLRLQLHDPAYQPCEGATYELTLASGLKRNGNAGPNGWISVAVPRERQRATIVYRPDGTTIDYRVSVEVVPSGDDATERYLADLRNLGFRTWQGDTGSMILRFQAAHGKLPLTGELDAATRLAIDETLRQPLQQTFEPDNG